MTVERRTRSGDRGLQWPHVSPAHGGHSVSRAESLTSLGLNLALNNTPSGLSVNIPSCPEGPLRITLMACRGGPGRLWAEALEADFPLSTLWALGLYNCCRKGDPFQGPKLGSCLTLGNELSETHADKARDFIGKGHPGGEQ